jgi:hypothetical protein
MMLSPPKRVTSTGTLPVTLAPTAVYSGAELKKDIVFKRHHFHKHAGSGDGGEDADGGDSTRSGSSAKAFDAMAWMMGIGGSMPTPNTPPATIEGRQQVEREQQQEKNQQEDEQQQEEPSFSPNAPSSAVRVVRAAMHDGALQPLPAVLARHTRMAGAAAAGGERRGDESGRRRGGGGGEEQAKGRESKKQSRNFSGSSSANGAGELPGFSADDVSSSVADGAASGRAVHAVGSLTMTADAAAGEAGDGSQR